MEPDILEPATPDYYDDLGLQAGATKEAIKQAFMRLAMLHHPDKQKPGSCTDNAREFRRVREAFEFLRDESMRARYDLLYPELREAWSCYRKREEDKRRAEEMRRAAVERERRKVENEAKRQRQEAEQARVLAEAVRLAKEQLEREASKALKEEMAEKRSREAATRAREAQEQAARERLRRMKEDEADMRSEMAIKKAREQQQQAAMARLAELQSMEKHKNNRDMWAKMRTEAEQRQRKPTKAKVVVCAHPSLGWPRRKGKALCGFCEGLCAKYSFRCPTCDIAACLECQKQYCSWP